MLQMQFSMTNIEAQFPGESMAQATRVSNPDWVESTAAFELMAGLAQVDLHRYNWANVERVVINTAALADLFAYGVITVGDLVEATKQHVAGEVLQVSFVFLNTAFVAEVRPIQGFVELERIPSSSGTAVALLMSKAA